MKKLLLPIILLSLVNLNATEKNPFKLQELLQTGRKLKSSQLVVAAHTCTPSFSFQMETADSDNYCALDSVDVYIKALKQDNKQKSLSAQEVTVAIRNIKVLKNHGAVIGRTHLRELIPLLQILDQPNIKK